VAWSFVLEDKPPMATELVLKELQNETKLDRWTHCRPDTNVPFIRQISSDSFTQLG